jgi:hypothetical protein
VEAEGWAGGNNPRMTYLFALLCPPTRARPDRFRWDGWGKIDVLRTTLLYGGYVMNTI